MPKPSSTKPSNNNTQRPQQQPKSKKREAEQTEPNTPPNKKKTKKNSDEALIKLFTEEIKSTLEIYFNQLSDTPSTYNLSIDDHHQPYWLTRKSEHFKRLLHLLNLNTSPYNNIDFYNLVKSFEQKVAKASQDPSDLVYKNLLQHNRLDTECSSSSAERVNHARWCLYPFLNTKYNEKNIMIHDCTELELTSRLFGSFCNISDLFTNTQTNAGVPLSSLLNNISLNASLKEKVDLLKPDRQVSFQIENSKVIRILQENSNLVISKNQYHQDELKMICQLKVCHLYLMKKILIENPTSEHLKLYSEIYTYGFLTSKNMIEFIGIRCNVDYNFNSHPNYSLTYFVNHFGRHTFYNDGKFYNNVLQSGKIMAIFSICEKQHKEILSSTHKSETNDDSESCFKFEEGDIVQICDDMSIITGKVLEAQNHNGKSIAKVQLDSEIVYLKYYNKHFNSISHFFLSVLVNGNNVELSLAGECLDTIKVVTFKQFIRIVTQLLIGLDIIHKSKRIHNDIKRSNIIIHNNFAKFIDYELIKGYEYYDIEKECCLNGKRVVTSFSGTRSTMPPEKKIGASGQISPKSDIYSLGVVFDQLFKQVEDINDNRLYETILQMIKSMQNQEKKDRPTITNLIRILNEIIPDYNKYYSEQVDFFKETVKKVKKTFDDLFEA